MGNECLWTMLDAVAPAAGTDVNAVHTNIGGEITALTAKATPTTSGILEDWSQT